MPRPWSRRDESGFPAVALIAPAAAAAVPNPVAGSSPIMSGTSRHSDGARPAAQTRSCSGCHAGGGRERGRRFATVPRRRGLAWRPAMGSIRCSRRPATPPTFPVRTRGSARARQHPAANGDWPSPTIVRPVSGGGVSAAIANGAGGDGTAWRPGFNAWLVRRYTTSDLAPERIRAVGDTEVDRIRGEMTAILREAGFAGDLPSFLAHLRRDPRFSHSP